MWIYTPDEWQRLKDQVVRQIAQHRDNSSVCLIPSDDPDHAMLLKLTDLSNVNPLLHLISPRPLLQYSHFTLTHRQGANGTQSGNNHNSGGIGLTPSQSYAPSMLNQTFPQVGILTVPPEPISLDHTPLSQAQGHVHIGVVELSGCKRTHLMYQSPDLSHGSFIRSHA